MLLTFMTVAAAVAAPLRSSFDPSKPTTRFNAPPPKPIPFPVGPAHKLPVLDGSVFAPYREVFLHGECTADDQTTPHPGGDGAINQNKTCFSCFRIPTLLGGQSPGVVHAFAEGRRGELHTEFHGKPGGPPYIGGGGGGCPDGPDTRLAYKRSTDNGARYFRLPPFPTPRVRLHMR